jgi:hypothetical protein
MNISATENKRGGKVKMNEDIRILTCLAFTNKGLTRKLILLIQQLEDIFMLWKCRIENKKVK